jgi:hypothetical protein
MAGWTVVPNPSSDTSVWKPVNAAAPAPEPPSLLRTMTNNFNANTQGAQPGDSGLKGFVENIGQGGGQVLRSLAHPIDTATSMAHSLMHPIDTAHAEVDAARSDPSRFIGNAIGQVGTGGILGDAASGALKGVGAAVDAIPSTTRAGANFESLNSDLANTPVPLNATLKPLQRITEIGERGSTLPTAVSKLLQRSQGIADMTFPEARDFQSSLSDLSATDKMAMGGRVSGGLKQLSKALYTDIQDAAENAGRGDDYAQAMKEYRQASGLKDMAKSAGKLAMKGAGAYGAYSAYKDLTGK